MKLKPTPPGLSGFALVFWGWFTENMIVALALAVLLESHWLIKWRFGFSHHFISRGFRYSYLTMWAVGFYGLFARSGTESVFFGIKWTPAIYFLITLLQQYNDPPKPATRETIPDLSTPFLFICLIAAGMANNRSPLFYWSFVALVTPVFWQNRSQRFHPLVWPVFFVLATGIGFLGQEVLRFYQAKLQERVDHWYESQLNAMDDPFFSYTAIGHIGRLKLSNRIVLRVQPVSGEAPSLLRMASYNKMGGYIWASSTFEFHPVDNPSLERWQIENRESTSRLTISQFFKNDSALLSMPPGSVAMDHLKVTRVQRHPLGAIKVLGAPRFVHYQVDFNPMTALGIPPDPNQDLQIPNDDLPAVDNLIAALDLVNLPPKEVMNRLLEYFDTQFTYSLNLTAGESGSALTEFLTQTKTGHCEFYATATTLVFRRLGIAARYVTGYSLQEYSAFEKSYIVRQRHSHAWALVWIDGNWVDVDTTPSRWNEMEEQNAPTFLAISDFFSSLWTVLTKWRGEERSYTFSLPLWARVVGMVVVLICLLLLRKAIRPKKLQAADKQALDWPGLDSECFGILRVLEARDGPRELGETLAEWLSRLRPERPELLQQILVLHNRYRFDPKMMGPGDRQELRQLVDQWLSEFNAKN